MKAPLPMRRSRLVAVIVVLALLFVGGFFAGAAFFKEGPVMDAVRSPQEGNRSDKAQ